MPTTTYPTKIEREALQGIYDSEFHDGQDRLENWVWSFSANPWDGTADSRKFAGALSSLIKKGWAKQSGEGREACVCLTAEGLAALNDDKKLDILAD